MWQPIETAPKDGTQVIGYNGEKITAMAYLRHKDDNGYYGWCMAGWQFGGMLYDFHYAFPRDKQPTHWMPLPSPPGDAE